MSENTNPDVIYLEADSEITEAIEKLKAASGDEVRIAVPPRSTMLQSAVNLRLLKKTAQNSGKTLVLVSSDKATMSLAAGIGVMVAKNVKAEAKLPEALSVPSAAQSEPIVIEQPADEGPSSGSDSGGGSKTNKFEKQHISLKGDEGKPTKSKRNKVNPEEEPGKKQPKVPNFMGLNKKIAIIAGVMAGVILLALGYIFLPTAKVTLETQAQKTPVNVSFTLEAGTKNSDFENGVIAADQISITKDLSAQYTATGKKDIGTKASGNVTVSNCSNSDDFSIPAGTAFTASGQRFSLGSSITVPGAKFSSGNCTKAGTVGASLTASANGDSYNLNGATFSIAGFDSKVNASGSTSGGSSKIATIVTQADIDRAKQEMIDGATAGAKTDLEKRAGDDQKVFEETFVADVTNVNASAPEGSESSGGTVSARVKYSELAASKKDLDELFKTQIADQIPAGNEMYQSGVESAEFTVTKASGETATIKAVADAYYGQTIDKDQVAKSIAGKRKKEAIDIVKPLYSQVESVQVETTPALVPNLPFFASRITIEIKVVTD